MVEYTLDCIQDLNFIAYLLELFKNNGCLMCEATTFHFF